MHVFHVAVITLFVKHAPVLSSYMILVRTRHHSGTDVWYKW